MARPLWTGSLSFGLVNVPVQLFSAVRDLDLHFRQLHEKDGAPIETRRFCAEEDERCPRRDRPRLRARRRRPGRPHRRGARARPRRARRARSTSRRSSTSPTSTRSTSTTRTSCCPPARARAPRAYQLLVEVDARTDRAALGPLRHAHEGVPRVVRVRDDRLALTTMLFHDEVRPTKDIETGGKKPAKAQLDQTVALIEAMAVDWDPSRYEDRYRERLLE